MAVVLDAVGAAASGTVSVSSFTYSGITVGSGANAALIVAVNLNGTSSTGFSVVWDSGGTNQTMTQLGRITNAFAGDLLLFGLRAPTPGNKTLSVSWTTASRYTVNAISFTGVNQTSDAAAFTNFNSNDQTAGGAGTSTATVAITLSNPGTNYALGVMCESGTTVLNSRSDTLWYRQAEGTQITTDGQYAQNPVSSPYTFTWNLAVADTVVSLGIEISPSGGAASSAIEYSVDTALLVNQTIQYQAKTDPIQETAREYRWYQPLSEPVRTKPDIGAKQGPFTAFGSPPIPAKLDSWWRQWLDPTRRVGIGPPWAQPEPYTPFETAREYRWFQPWVDPVRRFINAALQSTTAFTPVVTTANIFADSWFVSWVDPYRTKNFNYATQYEFFSESQQFPETVTEDRWHEPWSDPVRVKPGLGPQLAQPEPYSPLETAREFRWFQPLSEPTRRLTNVALQSTTAFTPVVTTQVNADSWFIAWLDPTRRRWDGASQQFIAQSESQQFPEIVSEDKWHQAWSEPVRTRNLAACQQPEPFFDPQPFTGENIFEDKWHYAWTDPVRQKPGLGPQYQQFIAQSESQQFPETVTEDRWHQAWSEPVRTKLGLRVEDQSNLAWVRDRATDTIGWYQPFAEVPKAKLALQAASQQFLAFDPAVFPAKLDGWWQSYAEVPKAKLGLQAGGQQFLALDPAVYVPNPDSWFEPFAEVPKPKPGLLAAEQASVGFVPVQPAAPSLSWFEPFAEVPRAKISLQAAAQPNLAFLQQINVSPPLAWFQGLSGPTYRRGIRTELQSVAAFYPGTIALQTVVARMATTEIDTDRAIFAINITPSVVPVTTVPAAKAIVSIFEIGRLTS